MSFKMCFWVIFLVGLCHFSFFKSSQNQGTVNFILLCHVQILSDKERLVRRTQLKRSAYKVLGKPEPEKPKEEQIDENTDKVPIILL